MKGVAATDPQDAFTGPSDGTIFFHRLNEIFAAGRVKPALSAYQMTECHLVDANETD
tara:strand:- start:523 stop:693 length:171 start_codon:yes stop_codon:yes gene_type:complete